MQNESIPDARGPVFCGVDTHADSHWLCVLDWRGRRVLSRRFPADAAGYEALAGAVKARTSAINTARSLLTTAPEGLRSRFRGMGGPRLMEELPSVC